MNQDRALTGRSAPDFRLPDASGQPVGLRDFLGRWLVLYFYPKDDTPGCTREAIDFTGIAGEFEKAGAAVVGISPDPPKSHDRFAAKHDLKVKLLSDDQHSVLSSYRAWGIKKMYGQEHEGVIRSTVLIDPSGTIVRHWPSVKVDGHALDVLSALKDVAGKK
jgi:thioredoxin-dependent peroxiredoxin